MDLDKVLYDKKPGARSPAEIAVLTRVARAYGLDKNTYINRVKDTQPVDEEGYRDPIIRFHGLEHFGFTHICCDGKLRLGSFFGKVFEKTTLQLYTAGLQYCGDPMEYALVSRVGSKFMLTYADVQDDGLMQSGIYTRHEDKGYISVWLDDRLNYYRSRYSSN